MLLARLVMFIANVDAVEPAPTLAEPVFMDLLNEALVAYSRSEERRVGNGLSVAEMVAAVGVTMGAVADRMRGFCGSAVETCVLAASVVEPVALVATRRAQ